MSGSSVCAGEECERLTALGARLAADKARIQLLFVHNQPQPHHSGRQVGRALVLKIGKINTAIDVPALGAGLSAPKAVIREAVQKIAQGYFRAILRGDAHQPI